MNAKKLGLDIFEMADDEEIRRIAADCPASPEEKERMFKLSQKIYNERTNESNEAHADEVSGVEQYKKPIWHKIVSAAAALALVAGLGAGGYMLARREKWQPLLAVSDEQLPEEESKLSNYPFGSLENERVRMTCSAIAPAVVELTPEKVSELASLLEEESWEETDEPNMADGEYYMLFFYNNGKSYELIIMPHNNIQFDTLAASDGKIYIGGSKIYDFLHTIKFEPDDFLYDMDDDSAEDFVNEVWTFDKKDITIDESSVNGEEKPLPDFTAKNANLAKQELRELGFEYKVVKIESTEIQPNYVIKTEPEAGTELRKGNTVTLYVSMGTGENVTVDDYIGKMAEDASIMAGYKGFKVYTYEIPSNEPQGTVVEQYPAAGTEAVSGGNVTLFTSKGGYTAGEITYKFIVPDDINGRYAVDFIWTDGDGITKVESSGIFVLPEYGNVVLTEISGKGNGCEATAYLTNLNNDKKAELGHYIFDFDKGNYIIEDEDIEGAFEAIK